VQAKKSRSEINAWVKQETKGKIDKILPVGAPNEILPVQIRGMHDHEGHDHDIHSVISHCLGRLHKGLMHFKLAKCYPIIVQQSM
jgi:hypothetical protein